MSLGTQLHILAANDVDWGITIIKTQNKESGERGEKNNTHARKDGGKRGKKKWGESYQNILKQLVTVWGVGGGRTLKGTGPGSPWREKYFPVN